MKILAALKAIILIISMGIYVGVYMLTRLFWKYTPASAYRLRRRWVSQMCIPVLNIKIEKKGAPIAEPALYVCNHRSFLDPTIKSKWLASVVIAKAEIANYPIINKGAEATGIIWVKRSQKDSRVAARQAMVDTIKSGTSVLVYPEGTTSTTKNTFPFKMGTFVAAAKEGFPVVPVALEYRNKSDMWLDKSLVGQYFQQCTLWKIETKLTFGTPIYSDNPEELCEKAHSWINDELNNMRKGWSNAFV